MCGAGHQKPALKETGLPPFVSNALLRLWVSQFTPDRDEEEQPWTRAIRTTQAEGSVGCPSGMTTWPPLGSFMRIPRQFGLTLTRLCGLGPSTP